ncbi:MAG: ATP-binding protein [Lachnospiraceae bacterium]|nr:ATP-binding protein [Lachnospiraceae bacterium]
MERDLLNELIKWKDSGNRKPLLLEGARQVGKTRLAREFGRRYFPNVVYLNFDKDRILHDTLEMTLSPDKLIAAIGAATGQRISPDDTLIIFDEIQEEPRALTALKYFNEEAPDYAIIATGSFMGIALHQGTSFPVGKVRTLRLYPLSFPDCLRATAGEGLVDLLYEKNIDAITGLKSTYIEALRNYYLVGGMPEVVQEFIDSHDYNLVRDKQTWLLDVYRQDFSKHAPVSLVPRLNQVWDAIPGQLAKENRKFIYGQIAKGARARDFETAIMWLADCGLIHLVHRINKPNIPLKAYEDISAFKIYANDVGLLGAMGNLPTNVILDRSRLFVEFKGALTEQYVLQQFLSCMKIHPFYYSADNSRGEIDFLFQNEDEILPVEVKAEENLQAKSLKAYVQKYGGRGARISMSDYREQDWLTNYPLYAFMAVM